MVYWMCTIWVTRPSDHVSTKTSIWLVFDTAMCAWESSYCIYHHGTSTHRRQEIPMPTRQQNSIRKRRHSRPCQAVLAVLGHCLLRLIQKEADQRHLRFSSHRPRRGKVQLEKPLTFRGPDRWWIDTARTTATSAALVDGRDNHIERSSLQSSLDGWVPPLRKGLLKFAPPANRTGVVTMADAATHCFGGSQLRPTAREGPNPCIRL